MSTHEEKLKKINEELEMLSDEELDYVVGGTRKETRELSIALNAILHNIDFSPLDIDNPEDMLYAKSDLEDELALFNGLTVKIDVGKGGTGVDEQANEYYYKGHKLTHEQMLKFFAPK